MPKETIDGNDYRILLFPARARKRPGEVRNRERKRLENDGTLSNPVFAQTEVMGWSVVSRSRAASRRRTCVR